MAARASDDGGLTYAEWSAARLVLLPKKGDLSLAKNWRGICLLDIGSKILSNIMVKRMQALMEQVAFEMQAGFRPELETIDGLFAVMMGLKKRRGHGLESYGVYVDFVKAFDTVTREVMWEVLRKFGMPDHFVNIPARPHTGAVMNVKIGEDDTAVGSSIGVRQGACEGPIPFLFTTGRGASTPWLLSVAFHLGRKLVRQRFGGRNFAKSFGFCQRHHRI
jgi:hypothetical protein